MCAFYFWASDPWLIKECVLLWYDQWGLNAGSSCRKQRTVLVKTSVFFAFLIQMTNCCPVNKEETVEITTATSILIRTLPTKTVCKVLHLMENKSFNCSVTLKFKPVQRPNCQLPKVAEPPWSKAPNRMLISTYNKAAWPGTCKRFKNAESLDWVQPETSITAFWMFLW